MTNGEVCTRHKSRTNYATSRDSNTKPDKEDCVTLFSVALTTSRIGWFHVDVMYCRDDMVGCEDKMEGGLQYSSAGFFVNIVRGPAI